MFTTTSDTTEELCPETRKLILQVRSYLGPGENTGTPAEGPWLWSLAHHISLSDSRCRQAMVTLAFSGRRILMEDTTPLVGHPDGGGGGGGRVLSPI